MRATVGPQNRHGRQAWRAAAFCVLLGAFLPLSGCGGFFSCDKASCPATTTPTTPTTSTADYAFVAATNSTGSTITGYNVGSGALTSAGSLALGYIPVALAIAPSNGFLYVASSPGASNPGVYLYTIGTGGALTATGTTPASPLDAVASMAISPDGNWLYTINTSGVYMSEYAINTSTGALTLKGQLQFGTFTGCTPGAALPVSQSCTVAVSPRGDYVVASLSVSGDVVFAYSSANGVSTLTSLIAPASSATGDFSLALDANDYAYIARTDGLAVYTLGATNTNAATFTYPAGTIPRSVTLSQNDNYVYTANEGTGTISAFGINTNGSLTTLTGSPYAGPANVSALGVDNTGAYMIAAGYDASVGIRLYAIGATGILTQVAATGSSATTSYPTLVAMTH